jgi:hypothetical protein
LAIFERRRGPRTRRLSDQCFLADEIPNADNSQRDLLTVAVEAVEADETVRDNVDQQSVLPLSEDGSPSMEGARVKERSSALKH